MMFIGQRGKELSQSEVSKVQALVSKAGILDNFLAVAASKSFGAAKSGFAVNVTSGYSQLNTSLGFKQAMEAPFVAMRVVVVNRAGNVMDNTSGANKILIGVTETAAIDTANNLSAVVIGGTAYNQLAPANTVNGFVPVTFSGSTAFTLGAGSSAVQYLVSDRIPLTSVPRADNATGLGASLPLALLRMDFNGLTNCAGGGFCFMNNGLVTGMRTANAANRGRILQMFGGSAMANTPANTGTIGITGFDVFLMPEYAEPVVSVLFSGDSIVQNDVIAEDGYDSWAFRACADASISGRRFASINMGCSNLDAINNWARTQEIINAGIVPAVLVAQPASVNDQAGLGWKTTANLPALVQTSKARTAEIVAYARSKGIKFICMMPLLPLNTQDATQSAARVAFNAWLQAYCTAMGLGYLNCSALGNGAAAEQWVVAYNNGGDGIHPNPAAFEAVLVPQLSSYLNGAVMA